MNIEGVNPQQTSQTNPVEKQQDEATQSLVASRKTVSTGQGVARGTLKGQDSTASLSDRTVKVAPTPMERVEEASQTLESIKAEAQVLSEKAGGLKYSSTMKGKFLEKSAQLNEQSKAIERRLDGADNQLKEAEKQGKAQQAKGGKKDPALSETIEQTRASISLTRVAMASVRSAVDDQIVKPLNEHGGAIKQAASDIDTMLASGKDVGSTSIEKLVKKMESQMKILADFEALSNSDVSKEGIEIARKRTRSASLLLAGNQAAHLRKELPSKGNTSQELRAHLFSKLDQLKKNVEKEIAINSKRMSEIDGLLKREQDKIEATEAKAKSEGRALALQEKRDIKTHSERKADYEQKLLPEKETLHKRNALLLEQNRAVETAQTKLFSEAVSREFVTLDSFHEDLKSVLKGNKQLNTNIEAQRKPSAASIQSKADTAMALQGSTQALAQEGKLGPDKEALATKALVEFNQKWEAAEKLARTGA